MQLSGFVETPHWQQHSPVTPAHIFIQDH